MKKRGKFLDTKITETNTVRRMLVDSIIEGFLLTVIFYYILSIKGIDKSILKVQEIGVIKVCLTLLPVVVVMSLIVKLFTIIIFMANKKKK